VALYEEPYGAILEALASGTPTPGGGTAAALAGAMAASLAEMVANLTLNRKKYIAVQPHMEQVAKESRELRARLLSLADEDAAVYLGVMAAYKLPKGSDSEISDRNGAILRAIEQAARVPLTTADCALRVLELVSTVAQKGNQNAITDAGVAMLLGQAAVEGALYNVYINLSSLEIKPSWAISMTEEAENIARQASALQLTVREQLQAIK